MSDPGAVATGDAAGVGETVAGGGGDASAQQGSASQVPAGWYPDPSGGGGQRYWDGAQWTEHAGPVVTEAGVASQAEEADGGSEAELAGDGPADDAVADAVAHQDVSDAGQLEASAAAASEPEIPAGWYPDPAGGSGQRWWDGTRWTDHVQGGSSGGEVGVGAADVTSSDASDEAAEAAPSDEGDTPLDDVDAADEPRDDVGYGDAELTQPLEIEGVDQAAAEDAGQPLEAEGVDQAATEDAAAAATPGVIPPGWYADPSGVGERWWSGDAWTEHVRSTGPSGTTGVDPASSAPGNQTQETQVMGAAGHGGEQPGASPSDQGGFSMTGVGDLPPSGPPPEGDDDGGGSGKLILAIVLIVILLAAIGAGLWFFTDVFDTEGEPAAAAMEETEERPEIEEPEPEPTFGHVRDVDYAEAKWTTTCIGAEGDGGSRPA